MANKINIVYIEHMGYYIPISDVEEFAFFSDKSRNYIEVVIKSESDKVTDIFECSQFKNYNLVK